jgi:hypothetical protein
MFDMRNRMVAIVVATHPIMEFWHFIIYNGLERLE